MALPPNYIPDQNKWKLAGPPDWFRRSLWEFDSSLVIVPSRQGFYYRLAQRRKLRLPEHIVNEALWKESDTQMLATYGLVPVTTILATVNWDNPLIFAELAARAPWRQGGADAVIQRLEAKEAAEEAKKNQAIDEHLTQNAKDAWRLYRTKIGLGRSWSTDPKKSQPTFLKPTGLPAHRKLFGNF